MLKLISLFDDTSALDDYLLKVSSTQQSHQFLGKAVQGCYIRLINLLKNYYAQQHRSPNTIRVLDWGTGKGHISYLLKKAGFMVTSCDLKNESCDSSFGQTTPIIDDHHINVVPLTHPSVLPFANNRFDLVVSFGVLEHVENDLASLKEIQRVLIPGGHFFFCFLPYWLSWTQRLAYIRKNYYHDRLYNKKQIKRLAISANFSVGKIWHGQLFPKNSLPYFPLLEKIDRCLTTYTPLKYLATNLEGFLIASGE